MKKQIKVLSLLMALGMTVSVTACEKKGGSGLHLQGGKADNSEKTIEVLVYSAGYGICTAERRGKAW